MVLEAEKDADGRLGANQLGLDEDEIKLLNDQLETPPSKAGYLAIYRFADRLDLFVMAACALVAIVAGSTMPLMTVVFGSLTGKFADFTTNSGGPEQLLGEVHRLVLYFVYIGIGSFLAISLHILGFTWTAQRISTRIRIAYLEAVLGQDMAFFDKLGAGEVATRITADIDVVHDGISQKVGLTISGVGSLVAAEVISFIISWRLALVMLCMPVVMTAWMAIVGGRMKLAQASSINAYAESSTLVEEVISSMRNVVAYGSQRWFSEKYDRSLVKPMKLDFGAKAFTGVLIGGMMWFMLSAFALSCWAGSRFKTAGDATVSQIVTVLLASAIAGVGFGMVAPHLQAFGAAAAAANRIFAVLDREPTIRLDSGTCLEKLSGHIMFDNVKLVYPYRRSQIVLEDFSLSIPAGKTTAIVGPSGSGKSSLFSLLERFYYPLRGRILLDGHDIRNLNLQWLRSQVKMVGQESFLFNTTVFENIAYGLAATTHGPMDIPTRTKLVEDAAKIANAHDFILELPQGYQTLVGEGGSSLSGGQRQRIAIARAVVCNPKVLLLDEATASLDTKSESEIQKALDAASAGRTTIVIAHRLSTIINAEKIVVVEHGRITEQGTHQELLANSNGTYASFVASQNLNLEVDGDRGGEATKPELDVQMRDTDASALERVNTKVSASNESPEPVQTSRYNLIKFLWKLNGPERPYLILGFIGSMISGLAYPITAILFGNLVLALHDDSSKTLGHKGVSFWAGMQWLLASVIFAAYLVQHIPFALASARLLSRARSVAFTSILRQDMAFFSLAAKHDSSSGTLTAFLAQQANQLNGLSGAVLGAVLNSAVAVVAGFAVAVGFGWKLGLVSASTMPLVVMTGYARFHVLADLEKRNRRGGTRGAGIVSEAVRGIRTVAALGIKDDVAARYRDRVDEEVRSGLPQDLLLSIMYGFSQSVSIFCSALVFWYGTRLILKGHYTVRDFLICFIATTYSAQAAGSIFSYAPDVAGAQEATRRLKRLLETVPAIDVTSDEGEQADNMEGSAELRNIDFAYPSSSHDGHLALKKVSLKASSGKFIALVGASGSGKSTVLGMLERFYDPNSGQVLAGGLDISRYRLEQYRKQMAWVEQDTTLNSGTIRDNITSGSDAEEAAIERACRQANIWEFVQSLPDGLNTPAGPRGSQVSGGQKQRLAIARALLRNPKILLLDEATSALDSRSETAVQKALSTVAVGRTTIATTHRLSSIAHADRIYVFEHGRVVEEGSHQELMAIKGKYWEYVGMQSLVG